MCQLVLVVHVPICNGDVDFDAIALLGTKIGDSLPESRLSQFDFNDVFFTEQNKVCRFYSISAVTN